MRHTRLFDQPMRGQLEQRRLAIGRVDIPSHVETHGTDVT